MERFCPMKRVSFYLPAPPSTNGLFRNVRGRGRVRTAEYNDFIAYGLSAISQQKPEPVKGYVVLSIGVERRSKRADIDNHVKALLDVIVKAGVLEDDRFVTAIAVSWLPPAEGLAHVAIYPVQHMNLYFQPSADGATGCFYTRFLTS